VRIRRKKRHAGKLITPESSSTENRYRAKDWAEEPLSEFMEVATSRLYQTHARIRDWWARLSAVDRTFLRIAQNLNESPNWFEGGFLIRAHSAYRAAARLAGSAQLPESYMVLRGCLEYGLYALYFAQDGASKARWLTRSDTPENRKKVRNEFTAGAMLRVVKAKSARLGDIAQTLYDRLIDYGAHPNDMGLAGTSSLTETEDKYNLEMTYIADDGVPARFCLKLTATVGIVTLRVFGLIFRERYQILGLDRELDRISQGL
jgi:hypothetical protein